MLRTCPDASELPELFSPGVSDERVRELEAHVLDCLSCTTRLKAALPKMETLHEAMRDETVVRPIPERLREIIDTFKVQVPGAEAKKETISLECPGCARKLAVKAVLAGKRVKCPGCGKPVAIPSPKTPPKVDATEEPTQSPSRIPDETADASMGSEKVDSPFTDFLAPPLAAGEIGRLGKYRILEVLGHGGMGVVFKGEDPKLKRLVAIKAMLPALAASASAGKRFVREAQTMAQVEHDHIVRVYQVDEDRGVPFMAMEFLKGEPLDKRLTRESLLPVDEVLRIGREIAQALEAAHEKGLIHRDIKPGNVWIEAPRGRVKLLDFGLARAASQDEGLTQQGAIIGTPTYMAPEQARGETVDSRCDLWSLGVVLYRMATGKQPFKGKDTVSTLMDVATREPEPPRQMVGTVPADLSALVMDLLHKDPNARIGSASEVVERIRAIEKSRSEIDVTEAVTTLAPRLAKSATTRVAPLAAGAPPRRRRNWLIALAAAGAFAAILAAGTVFFWQSPNGLVRIEIDDDDSVVTLTKTGATIKKADKKDDISLAAGSDHRIKVTRGNDFSFETSEFVLKSGDKVTLKVSIVGDKIVATANEKEIGSRPLAKNVVARPTLPAGQETPLVSPPPSASDWALQFDGTSHYVRIPDLTLDLGKPFTVELRVRPEETIGVGDAFVFAGTPLTLTFPWDRKWRFWAGNEGPATLQADQRATIGEWIHLAAVCDGERRTFYVDGRLQKASAGTKSPTIAYAPGFTLAAKTKAGKTDSGFFRGAIGAMRVSQKARYDRDFTPAMRFEPDADTLALYRFDEGAGDVLKDSSGNRHHGKITGAKWVKADGTPIAVRKSSLALPADPANPFAVVSPDGKHRDAHASLTAALTAANDGDWIEVAGDGPFTLGTIIQRGKGLRIRAATGYRPTFVLTKTPSAYHWFQMENAAVEIEGCDFRCGNGLGYQFLAGTGPSCEFRNCRLLGADVGFISYQGAKIRFVDCLIDGFTPYGNEGFGPGYVNSELEMKNCIVSTVGYHFLQVPDKKSPNWKVKLEDNTMLINGGLALALQRKEFAKVGLDATGNLLNVNGVAMKSSVLRDGFGWTGRDNLYVGPHALLVHVGDEKKTTDVRGLAAWKKLWGESESGGTETEWARFAWDEVRRLGNEPSAALKALAPFVAEAATRHALPDLGPEWDLVGPGDAYVRALAASGRDVPKDKLRPAPSAGGAFVIIRDGNDFAGFPTLGAAASAARDLDVIEVRSDDPIGRYEFSSDRTRELTLRAGPGYRPVFDGGLDFVGKKLTLAIEGFHFQNEPLGARLNGSPTDLTERTHLVRIANCSFDSRADFAMYVGRMPRNGVNGLCLHGPDGRPGEIVNCFIPGLVSGTVHAKNKLIVRNSVVGSLHFRATWSYKDASELELDRCVLWNPSGDLSGISVASTNANGPKGRFEVVAKKTLFEPGRRFVQVAADVELMRWTGAGNVYRIGHRAWLAQEGGKRSAIGLADWKLRWNSDADSAEADPLEYDPRQWRLLPGGVGQGARPDGKDIGADVSRIAVK